MACQLKDDSFSLGHLIDGKADENQTIPRERKECRHTELYLASQLRSLITQGWLLCAAYAWHSCKEHSCFSPKLLKVCELFCLQQPHPLISHGSCCTLLLLKGDFFFFCVRFSDTSYGSLIRPERLSDAATPLTGCCGVDHMPRVIYASVVRNINLALCFITLSAYLTVRDTMKVNQIAAKSAVPLPVYHSTASFSALDQCTS